jgi:hypothetical protein
VRVGLKLRYNLFYSTTEPVFDAFASFYGRRGRRLHAAHDESGSLNFYGEHNGWVVVDLGGGWEWKVRREAQLVVSRSVWCPGFLIFAYDGNYWGYEFFDRGEVIDHFVQEAIGEPIGFPGEDCRGNPRAIAERLPFLRVEDVAPYLMQKRDFVIPEGMNVPARPGDEFRRFDECAVLDFLRMLGVLVEIRDHKVHLKAPLFRSVE